MKSNKCNVVVGVLITTILVIVGFFIFNSPKDTIENKPVSTNIKLSVPDGWYLHRLSDTSVLLTRQETLPDIANTESYAYGEQISLNVIPMTKTSPEAWVAQKTYIDLTDTLILKSEWGEIDGHKLLSVEQMAAGASGKIMSRYLFVDNIVHIFSLYPLESYDPISKEQKRWVKNIDTLEQILQDYVAQL